MARGDSPPGLVRAAALRLFARHGVAATSLQMIADELGVTKAAVYHHYRTKAAIVDAVLEPAMASLAVLVQQAEGIVDVTARQELIVATLAKQAVKYHQLHAVVLRELPISELMRSASHAGMLARLQELLEGPGAGTTAIVNSGIFLTGLIAPTTDARLAEVAGPELERAVAAAGRALLGLPAAKAD